jgi:tetratricopeptide (TPR) repeat protein
VIARMGLLGWLALADAGAPVEAAPPAVPVPVAAPAPAPAPEVPVRGRAKAEHAQAMAALRGGRVEEAAALFGQAVAHDPTSAPYATDWGFALGKLGRRAEAEAALRQAIARDPRRSYAYVNLADLLASDPARWERRDAIVADLDKGLDALKEDRKGRFNLVLALAGFERAVGRTAEARARLAPLLETGAPALSRLQRKRVLDLLDGIAVDERARSLEDWPAPAPELAHRLLAEARSAEAAGQVDDAIRNLEIAVNLAPSDADAWRALGRLLAAHGGALELDRADDALRNALALEPAWSDLRELRVQIARRRRTAAEPAAAPHTPPPTEKARALYQEAEDWIDVGDPIGMGRDLLEQALAESPAFVPAALSLYALSGSVPDATVAALQDDGPGLWALASGVRKLGAAGKGGAGDQAAAERLVHPWIDRAVALDVQEARFARAAGRAAAGDKPGALADLVAYLAREPAPAHLAEARALRAGLVENAGERAYDGRLPPQLVARIRLVEDRPDAALRALGGGCAAGLPPERLVALGLVEEFADHRAAARACYELAGAQGDRGALQRLARLNARSTDAELQAADRRLIDRAAAQGVGAAMWARARLERRAGQDEPALADARAALAAAGEGTPADGWIDAARAAEHDLADGRRANQAARRARRRRLSALAGGAALLLVLGLARRRWAGSTVAAALHRRPELFPEVARAIAELRHDVLKHRAGVLGAIAEPSTERDEVLRAMTEPRPTSQVVAGLYDKVAQAARGAGVALKPLAREPVFGALVADLARAEQQLLRPRPERDRELLAIDARLRGEHADRLAALLEMAPRTRLDAGVLSSWIAGVEAATRRAGHAWTPPGLSLADLQLDFPVGEEALAAIFANLLRNAQAAVAEQPEPRVIVRLDREQDVTGRPLVTLFVGDSAARTPTLDAIEARESGRGLAIVRDAVRQWRGHLVVRAEPAPLAKLIGASFPS